MGAMRCDTPLLTALIPVYNEAATIGELLTRVAAAPVVGQIVVVDDGSTDATCEILARWASTGRVVWLRHDCNRGKGAAIRTGLQHACGRFTVIQDADLEYDPRDLQLLLEPLLAGEAEAVFGSRYLSAEGRARGRWQVLRHGVSLLNLIVRMLYGVRLTDEATCYKVFPTDLLRALDLQCRRFEFSPEVTAKLCRLGIRIHEVPIRYCPRTTRQGKKLRLRDGWAALRELWRWRRWQASPSLPSGLPHESQSGHPAAPSAGPASGRFSLQTHVRVESVEWRR
jgi:glycosyltransferase involved in cell wall biosynthesis